MIMVCPNPVCSGSCVGWRPPALPSHQAWACMECGLPLWVLAGQVSHAQGSAKVLASR